MHCQSQERCHVSMEDQGRARWFGDRMEDWSVENVVLHGQ